LDFTRADCCLDVANLVLEQALIAEIMLYSEGFVTAKILSKKLTGLFELMIQQLSKQVQIDSQKILCSPRYSFVRRITMTMAFEIQKGA
jgi:hypothetical protein